MKIFGGFHFAHVGCSGKVKYNERGMYMIRPVEFQGVMQRNQDVASIAHKENQMPHINNENALSQTKKEVEIKVRDVNQKEKAENRGKNHDAKEKGNNEYFGDGGKNRRKFSNTKGTVVIKERKSFDAEA